jgi:predicted site-specific integrase-resolvase
MRKRTQQVPESTVKVYNVTVRAAASRLDVSTETIKRWARSGKVDARKNTSGNWVFESSDIDAMLDRHVVTEAVQS